MVKAINWLRFHGTGTDGPWEDSMVPGNAVRAGASAPVFQTFRGGSANVYANAFVSKTIDEVHVNIQLPHSYRVNTDVSLHVHWSTIIPIPAGQTVIWGVDYTWASIEAVFPATQKIVASYTSPVGDTPAYKHTMTTWADIPSGGSKGISSILCARIYRDGSTDTFTGDAYLIGIDAHYRLDSIGSNTLANKRPLVP
jgi:hypothetical protein